MTVQRSIIATAPAKAILIGEHAVNRGQAALATSIGCYCTCTLTHPVVDSHNEHYRFQTKGQEQETTRDEILELGQRIDLYRAESNYQAIQTLVAQDFFAPAKYVLASYAAALPASLDIHFTSQIPRSAGLGSGGASFIALAAALKQMLTGDTTSHQQLERITTSAWRGDVVAHGGTASGLDTQTSFHGGVIRYTLNDQGQRIACSPGLTLVIGNTNITAATSEVNARVRSWLAEDAVRLHYFQEIGILSRHAEQALATGDWTELGHLLNLNQLLLERIGVSCPELERLNTAALRAGALGAKLSGSGGGGIMIALVTADRVQAVSQAIADAGGTPLVAQTGVHGVLTYEG